MSSSRHLPTLPSAPTRRVMPALWLACLLPVIAGAAPFSGTPSGPLLAAGNSRVMLLAPDGQITWQHPTKLTHDVWMLANGNILYADGETVTEITRAHKIAWQYQAELQKGGGTYACQRLANGNTLVGENSTGRVLEVDGAGKVVFALNTTPCQPGDHQNMRMARKLASGNYLVCHSGAQLVKEYTPKGEVVWEVKAPGALAFAAIRTANDTTLVSSLDQITEFDRAGKKVWQFTTRDPEGVKIRNMTGLHLQRDGSLVIGCYQAYDQGEGSALFMINRDKQILWRYANPKADGTMMAVQLLSPEGRSAPGPCQR